MIQSFLRWSKQSRHEAADPLNPPKKPITIMNSASQKCIFKLFTTAQIERLEFAKKAAADSGSAFQPIPELPRLIAFNTYEVPLVGEELLVGFDNREVLLKVLKRTWVFSEIAADVAENVTIKLEVEELA
jgi:hypothetical protein